MQACALALNATHGVTRGGLLCVSAILTCDSDNAGVDRAPESELTGMSDEAQPSGQQAEQGLSSEEELAQQNWP